MLYRQEVVRREGFTAVYFHDDEGAAWIECLECSMPLIDSDRGPLTNAHDDSVAHKCSTSTCFHMGTRVFVQTISDPIGQVSTTVFQCSDCREYIAVRDEVECKDCGGVAAPGFDKCLGCLDPHDPSVPHIWRASCDAGLCVTYVILPATTDV